MAYTEHIVKKPHLSEVLKRIKANKEAISSENKRAVKAEKSNADAISAEVKRATEAEEALKTAITTETNRAQEAEQENANAISELVTTTTVTKPRNTYTPSGDVVLEYEGSELKLASTDTISEDELALCSFKVRYDYTGGSAINTDIPFSDLTYSRMEDSTDGLYAIKVTVPAKDNYPSTVAFIVYNSGALKHYYGISVPSNGIYFGEAKVILEDLNVIYTRLESITVYEYATEKVINNEVLDLPNNDDFKTLESLAKGATSGISFRSYEDMIAELNSASRDTYRVGQNFYIQTRGVPDVWVTYIYPEGDSVPYTYVDDASILAVFDSGVTLRAGYFRVSPLETAEVDLENYATKEALKAKQDKLTNNQNYMVVPTLTANSETVSYRKASISADEYAIPLRYGNGNIPLPKPDLIPDNSDNAASVNKVLRMITPIQNMLALIGNAGTISGQVIPSYSSFHILSNEYGAFIIIGDAEDTIKVTYPSGTYIDAGIHILIKTKVLTDSGSSYGSLLHIFGKGGEDDMKLSRRYNSISDAIEVWNTNTTSGAIAFKIPMRYVDWSVEDT